MIEKLTEAPKVENNYYITKKTITAEKVINKSLWFILIVLIISVLATYFVEKVPGFVFDLRTFAIDSIWVTIGCYSIGEVIKLLFRNKGRGTEEYKKAKKGAESALEGLTTDEYDARDSYCDEYEETVYRRGLERLLRDAGITKEEYVSKYAFMSRKELKKKYPTLSSIQVSTLAKANKLKRVKYDSSFFLMVGDYNSEASPSQMFNPGKAEARERLVSVVLTTISSFFAVSLVGELIFSFSIAVLFAAVIKATVTILLGAFKADFGWKLAMHIEVGKFMLVAKECANLKNWYSKKHTEGTNGSVNNDISGACTANN